MHALLSSLARVNGRVARWSGYLCVAGLLVLVSGVFVNVLVRYLTGRSHAGVGEGAVIILLWIVLLGAVTGYHQNMFPAFTGVYSMLPRRLAKPLNIAVLVASLLVFGYVANVGLQFAQASWGQSTPIFDANRGMIYLALPLSAALLLLSALEKLLEAMLGEDRSPPGAGADVD